MGSFSLLYRVFYDQTLAQKVVSDGKGAGFGPLFRLAFLASLFWALGMYMAVRPLTADILLPILEQNEEIRFEGGRITKPEGYEYVYVSPEKDFFFIFDTTQKPLSFKDLPPKGIYVTQDRLFRNGRRTGARATVPFDYVFAQIFSRSGLCRFRRDVFDGILSLRVLFRRFIFFYYAVLSAGYAV